MAPINLLSLPLFLVFVFLASSPPYGWVEAAPRPRHTALLCETCQVAMFALKSHFGMKRDKIPEDDRTPEAIANLWTTLISEVCNKKVFEDYIKWVDLTGKLDPALMAEVCDDIIGDIADDVELFVMDVERTQVELRERFCQSRCTVLWKPWEHPGERMEMKKNKNLVKEAEGYMAVAAKQKDAVKVGDGVVYRVIESGWGTHHPGINSSVSISFDCFQNGEKLSSTGELVADTKPFDLTLGWQQVLMKMVTGDFWEIWIPWYLAYGSRGEGDAKPFSTIMCKTRLWKVDQFSEPNPAMRKGVTTKPPYMNSRFFFM